MSKRIVAFGELVWDLFPDDQKIGGAPVNLVFRVNAMGDEGFLLSRIGEDQLGHDALAELAKLKISDSNVQVDPIFPTGTAHIRIGSEGRPDYVIEPDMAFDHIEFTAEALKLVRSADCLVYGTLVQRYGISKNTLRELLKESPAPVKYLDLKLRKNCFNRPILESSLEAANILRVKENELFTLKSELGLFEFETRALAQEVINEYNIDIVLVTKSKSGACAVCNDGSYFEDPGYKIDIVDTVGSGSAFSAAFLHVYLENRNVEEALNFANAAGAAVAATHGATSYISKRQITELMRSGERRK
ncbi:sugar/nucleoside kinase, ribokinase family [Bacteroidales bacterium 6E]|nr:sugar/nucleoside kinase, ribokinase family [Bacteroidales bacterium 6E]